jgi:hypothetical protein
MAITGALAWATTAGPLGNGTNQLLRFDPFLGGTSVIGSFAGVFTGGGVSALSATRPLTGVAFCVATPNETGAGAHLQAEGSTSFAANDLSLYFGPIPPNRPGLVFFGPQAIAAVPFGNGVRCVGGALLRLQGMVSSPEGVIGYDLDLGAMPLGGTITPGSTWHFQAYFREPGIGAGFNSSNALSLTFAP